MACTCVKSPGKFEGEGAAALLAYWHQGNGGADTECGATSFFKSPLMFDADQGALAFAREYGRCAECIESAIDHQRTIAGASITEDSNGFVYYREFKTAAEYERAVSEAEAEEGDDE